jgi:periplasmic protein TonB
MRKRYCLLFSALTALSLSSSTDTYANTYQLPLPIAAMDTLPQKDTAVVDTTLFAKVDFEATFPGGEAGWHTFLENNLRADVPVRRKAPAGKYTVVVQFIVDKQGKLSDIQPLTALGYGMEQELVRVLRKSPRWLPAQMNGEPVKAYRRQPLTFVVSEVRK